MKQIDEPTWSCFTLTICFKMSSGWLQHVFHVGAENWKRQLKNHAVDLKSPSSQNIVKTLARNISSWYYQPPTPSFSNFEDFFWTMITKISRSSCKLQRPGSSKFHLMILTYLIFVISFTQVGFWNAKIATIYAHSATLSLATRCWS